MKYIRCNDPHNTDFSESIGSVKLTDRNRCYCESCSMRKDGERDESMLCSGR
jgi:hypothetical protein